MRGHRQIPAHKPGPCGEPWTESRRCRVSGWGQHGRGREGKRSWMERGVWTKASVSDTRNGASGPRLTLATPFPPRRRWRLLPNRGRRRPIVVSRRDSSLPVTRPAVAFWVRRHRLRNLALSEAVGCSGRALPQPRPSRLSDFLLFRPPSLHPAVSSERTVEHVAQPGGFLPSEGTNSVIFSLRKGVKPL